MNVYGDFENVWKRFEGLARGKITEKSGQAPLTAAAAGLAVSTAAAVWTDRYDPCGKWLETLRSENAEKARQIAETLQSIELVEVPPEKQISDLSVIGVSAGGALVGAGISIKVFHAGMLGSAASTILPAIALYPIMKRAQSEKRKAAEKRLIEQYVGQLGSIRGLIMEILK